MIKKISLIAVGLLMLIGCAGKSFSFKDASVVKLGDSGATVIEKMGGSPYQVRTELIDGKPSEKYIYVSVNGMTGSSKSLSFILVEDRVVSVPIISQALLNNE